MKKSVVALALAAVALAGAGAYLLKRIDAERAWTAAIPGEAAQAPSSAQTAAPAEPRDAASPPAPASASPAATPEVPARDTRAPATAPPEDPNARQKRMAAEYLARFDDPAQHPTLRETELAAARRTTAGAAERLKLTSEQYEKLVQLLADQSFERRVAAARCLVDALCLVPTRSEAYDALDRQIRELVGENGTRELRNFSRAEMERRVVDGLQSRLTEGNALTQAQADQLVAALFDEARLLDRAMRDHHRAGFLSTDGPSLRYTDRADSMELMLQSGEAHVQALRDRAATQLTGQQLATLNEMYDDLLIEFRRHLRIKAAGR